MFVFKSEHDKYKHTKWGPSESTHKQTHLQNPEKPNNMHVSTARFKFVYSQNNTFSQGMLLQHDTIKHQKLLLFL